MSKLNSVEARKLWVAALRSGEYPQGTDYIHKNGKFDCFGVACEMHRIHEGGPDWKDGPYGSKSYMGHSASLPPIVTDWLGLFDGAGMIYGRWSLTEMTDWPISFSKIADVIESEPRGL